jgi:hypothetical protein
MPMDDMVLRMTDELRLRAYDKYIDRKEEQEILQSEVDRGASLGAARAALWQVCEANGYVVESVALNKAKEMLEVFNEGDGVIDEKEFADSVAALRKAVQGRLKEQQCKRFVIELIEDNRYKTSKGVFNNWFKRVKHELGMA